MSTYAELKKRIDAVESFSSTPEFLKSIIMSIKQNDPGYSEVHFDKYMKKGTGEVTYEMLFEAVEKALKKQNRTLHAFDSLDDLRLFDLANKCGDWWYDKETGKYYVYAY